MFSLVKGGLFLKPLPYPDPDHIVRVLEQAAQRRPNSISTPNYFDSASQNTHFGCIAGEDGLAGHVERQQRDRVDPGRARVRALLQHLPGGTPALGRPLLPNEGHDGKEHVVLLSHVLWESYRFGCRSRDAGERHLVEQRTPYRDRRPPERECPFDRTAVSPDLEAGSRTSRHR